MTTKMAQEVRPTVTVTACHCGDFWCQSLEHLTPELRASEPRIIANDAALALIGSTVAATVAVRVDAHDAALDLIDSARARSSRRWGR